MGLSMILQSRADPRGRSRSRPPCGRTHKSEIERHARSERAFRFIRMNERECKPRTRGITEIRGPYYTPMGKRYLEDVLETMGKYVDPLKFAGGSFPMMAERQLKEILGQAQRNN